MFPEVENYSLIIKCLPKISYLCTIFTLIVCIIQKKSYLCRHHLKRRTPHSQPIQKKVTTICYIEVAD